MYRIGKYSRYDSVKRTLLALCSMYIVLFK